MRHPGFRNYITCEGSKRYTFILPLEQLDTFEDRINYRFKDRKLLLRALTHPSYVQQHPQAGPHNQRLEFLGDAVLNLMLAEHLFEMLPGKREGELTRNRAALSKGAHLAHMGQQLGLHEVLLLSEGEEANEGRERASIIEDAFEALIAAIFLDSDYVTTRSVVLNWYGDLEGTLNDILEQHNPKGRFQEQVQPILGNSSIRYAVKGTEGPDHRRRFNVEIYVNDECWGSGKGSSKKEAEEAAARMALRSQKLRELLARAED